MEYKQPTGQKVQAEITQNGQYSNFYPTGSDKHGAVALRPGDYVVAVKTQYVDPAETESKYYKNADGSPKLSWRATFELDGTEVAMFINRKDQADAYAKVAGLDEPFKIYWDFEEYEYNGATQKRKAIKFAPGAE